MAKHIVAFLGIFLLSALSVCAQSLRTATQVFAVTAAADWTMTGIGLSRGAFTELNPSLRWAQNDPARVVAAGVALDVAGVYALHHWVAPRHPKVAVVVLYAQSAARVYFVSRGVQFMQQQGRR